MKSSSRQSAGFLRSLGPAIIVACVVLGPGSILANSKIGWQFGFSMIWVLVAAVVLMIGMTALAARVGVLLDRTPGEELAAQAGRPWAVLVGGCVFLVCASFQFGNNLGVLFAIEPFLDGTRFEGSQTLPFLVLVGLNGVTLLALFGLRRMYQPVEQLMKWLVGLMIIGFAANVLFASPSLLAVLAGLIPSLPADSAPSLLPQLAANHGTSGRTIIDPWWPMQALIGTTFSMAGAFYQSYLVRQKGWTRDDLSCGLRDSIVGISTLGFLSLLVMITAAAVLHGNPDVHELNSAADVARQLQPLFGIWAPALFCLGIFAGAFSSFLVNAMIGGTMLADGFGKGGSMDQRWPKLLTGLVLLLGMAVALAIKRAGWNMGNLILFAQAITVLINPLLAAAMLWMASRIRRRRAQSIPLWMLGIAWLGFAVVIVLSLRTGYRLYLQMAQAVA